MRACAVCAWPRGRLCAVAWPAHVRYGSVWCRFQSAPRRPRVAFLTGTHSLGSYAHALTPARTHSFVLAKTDRRRASAIGDSNARGPRQGVVPTPRPSPRCAASTRGDADVTVLRHPARATWTRTTASGHERRCWSGYDRISDGLPRTPQCPCVGIRPPVRDVRSERGWLAAALDPRAQEITVRIVYHPI